MNITAQQARMLLGWQSVCSGELGYSLDDKEYVQLVRSLVECLKDCQDLVHEDNVITYHQMYGHFKEHIYNEYYGKDM